MMLLATRADHDLTHSGRARRSRLGHWGEAFVVVGVTVQDQVGARLSQDLPQWRDTWLLAGVGASRGGVSEARTQGVVPHGRDAPARMGGQVSAQPSLLRRAGVAGHLVAVGVQGDHVPAPDVEGVVALRRVAGSASEVAEVTRRGPRRVVVFMVAGHRAGDRLVGPEEAVVGARELGGGPLLVLKVPEGEEGRRPGYQRRDVALATASEDTRGGALSL